MELKIIHENIAGCTKCELSRTRTNTVPGEGDPNSKLMFIGEAPGRNEDLSGKPFCGAAGNILTELLNHIGLDRKDVFITSILKCRPPNNRLPKKEEAECCMPHLDAQFNSINPKYIVLMGNSAIKYVFGKLDMSSSHGKVMEKDGRNYFITYHPAAILYRRHLMDTVKEDFRKLKGLV